MVFGIATIVFAVPIVFFPRRHKDAPDYSDDSTEKDHLMTTKEKVKGIRFKGTYS